MVTVLTINAVGGYSPPTTIPQCSRSHHPTAPRKSSVHVITALHLKIQLKKHYLKGYTQHVRHAMNPKPQKHQSLLVANHLPLEHLPA